MTTTNGVDRNGKVMIRKGTLVRIRTTNGGDSTVRLEANHYPTYDVVADFNGNIVGIPSYRIASIEIVTT